MVASITHLASALESARSITKEAAAVVTSKLGESSYTQFSQSLDGEQLTNYLNSRNTREVKDAMKRIISSMASGDTSLNVEYFFADVLKNITSTDPKVKRLVYVYLLRFAERDPDLALLSVNSIQKLLNDSDPELRCFAIKALSDIRIQSLIPIVIHSLKKAVTDPSAIVRSEVAYALLKLFRWRTSLDDDEFDFLDTIKSLCQDLLSDSEPRVISACIILFQTAFPDKLEWLHRHFRYYCKILKQLDSWSQSLLIELFIRYCKQYISKPKLNESINQVDNNEEQTTADEGIFHYDGKLFLDEDLALFLNQLLLLRFSSNPLVILSCCNAYYQLSTSSEFKTSKFPDALFRTFSVTQNEGIQTTILGSILLYSTKDITLFDKYVTDFLLLPDDSDSIASLKLEILRILVNEMNVKQIIHNLKQYILYSEIDSIILTSMDVLLSCANLTPTWENQILKWLVHIMETTKLSLKVLDSFVNVIRKLIITNPLRHMKVVFKLSQILESKPDMADNARAGLIWLFGEMTIVEFRICPDILRKLIPNFTHEGVESRNAILLFAAKLLSVEIDKQVESQGQFDRDNSTIAKMYDDIIYLSKFDDEYDVRDRVRFISSIFESGKYQIATLLFQAPKPTTRYTDGNSDSQMREGVDFIDNEVKNYFNYQPWNGDLNETENGVDIREPMPLKDYNRYKKSISSNSFISNNNISRSFASEQRDNQSEETSSKSIGDARSARTSTTVSGTPKYKLQSLDDFFSDVPSNPSKNTKHKKKIVIEEEEESSSEEETTSTDGDDDETSSEEETSDSSSSDSDSTELDA